MKTALLQICLRRSISWITFRNYFKSKKLRNNTTYRHLKITTPSRRLWLCFLIDEIYLNKSVNHHEVGYQQNAWPFIIENIKTMKRQWFLKDVGRTYKTVDGDTGEDNLIIRWSSCWKCRMTACVCVGCVSVCVCKLLCIQCILYFCVCVGVRTNSINIKVRHISFIKKQFGQRRGQCSQHVCPKQAYLGPGVYCVFYIACVTLSNTVH